MSTESTQETERIASEWLMHRESGSWTAEDQTRFDEWMSASSLNPVAYLRLELGWEETRRLKVFGAGVSGDEPPPAGQWNLGPFFKAPQDRTTDQVRAPAWRPIYRLGIAATVVAALVLGWHLWPRGHFFETPIGGTALVPTSDGSKITLNTDSQIRVAFTQAERRIDLEQGEAFFEVAKDPGRPFVVDAGKRRIVALATQFSVRRDRENVQVVVTEGAVRVEDKASRSKPVLQAGSMARATDAGVWVDHRTVGAAEERLSWRRGVLMFRNQTLAQAVAEFNRYNTRQLVIEDPSIGSLKIEGNFRLTNVDAFARLLEEVYPVTVVRQSSTRLAIEPR